MESVLTAIFIFWLVLSFICSATLTDYNKAGYGFLLGAFLGPIGLVCVLIIKNGEERKKELLRQKKVRLEELEDREREEKECPFCAEKILINAKVCKHCGNNMSL